MVIAMAVLTLLLLLPLTLGHLALGRVETVIASNHRDGSQAFYCAESGIELAVHRLQNGIPYAGTTELFDQCSVEVSGVPLLLDESDPPQLLEVGVTSQAIGPANAKRRIQAIVYRTDASSPWRVRAFREVPQP